MCVILLSVHISQDLDGFPILRGQVRPLGDFLLYTSDDRVLTTPDGGGGGRQSIHSAIMDEGRAFTRQNLLSSASDPQRAIGGELYLEVMATAQVSAQPLASTRASCLSPITPHQCACSHRDFDVWHKRRGIIILA